MSNIEKVLIDELDDLTDLRKLKASDLRQISAELINVMRFQISRGFSPISGRRFPKYKNPTSYPGDLKPSTPVNLELDGDFLEDLRAKIKTGKTPTITIFLNSAESNKKEQGHREGANGQPKRPIIPIGDETFSKAVNNVIDDAVQDVLDKRFD